MIFNSSIKSNMPVRFFPDSEIASVPELLCKQKAALCSWASERSGPVLKAGSGGAEGKDGELCSCPEGQIRQSRGKGWKEEWRVTGKTTSQNKEKTQNTASNCDPETPSCLPVSLGTELERNEVCLPTTDLWWNETPNNPKERLNFSIFI